MSEVKLTGTVVLIKDTQVVSDKFSKREFVVNDNSMYPQLIQFEAIQDSVSMLDGFNVGDDVNVYYNLRGREWTNPQGETKYFNTLVCWKIEEANGTDLPG